MRILALSDVHGRAETIERLLRTERSRFDTVVVAGDMSGPAASARDILAPLGAFGCPVLYLYGNWDRHLRYDEDLGTGLHLHGQAIPIGDYTFVGFSGCESGWGANPIALKLRPDRRAPPAPSGLILQENIRAMAASWRASGAAADRTIVVTHDRCPRLGEHIPGAALHLFGHQHGFRDTTHLGIRYVNVSAMDMGSPKGGRPKALQGNYTVIGVRTGSVVEAKPVPLFG